MTASRLRLRYAAALVLAQLLAGVELTVLVMPLRHQVVPDAAAVFGMQTLTAAIVLAALSVTAVIGYAIAVVDGRLRWFTDGRPPAPRDRAFVRRLLRNQSAMLTAIWAASGVVLFVVNRHGGGAGGLADRDVHAVRRHDVHRRRAAADPAPDAADHGRSDAVPQAGTPRRASWPDCC